MMKICYASSNMSVYDLTFLQAMSAAGHTVLHVAYVHEPEVLERPVVGRIRKLPHVDCEYLQPRRALAWGGRYRLGIDYYRRLARIVTAFRPDILHGGWVTRDGFCCALTGYHPFLLMPWGTDILVRPFEGWCNYRIARYAIRHADAVTCDCEWQKKHVVEVGGISPDTVVTFPWGIDLVQFQPGDGTALRRRHGWADKTVLLMDREFKPVYGHEYFCAALRTLARNHPDLRFFLLHDGPLRRDMMAGLDAAGLQDRYHYAGLVSREELAAYLNAADIYVSTSLSDGTSCSMLEAMACGLPVVVSDLPVSREWVLDGENGFLVRCRDPKDIEEKITRLLADPALRRSMGDRNLAVARERADWQQNYQTLEAIYARLRARATD